MIVVFREFISYHLNFYVFNSYLRIRSYLYGTVSKDMVCGIGEVKFSICECEVFIMNVTGNP